MARARGKSTARRKTGKRSTAQSRSSFWPWVAALVAVGGGIVVYDNVAPARRLLAGLTADKGAQTASREERRATLSAAKPQPGRTPSGGDAVSSRPTHGPVPPRPVGVPDQSHTAAIVPPAPIGKPARDVTSQEAPRTASPPQQDKRLAGAYDTKFFLCGTAKQDDCVLSADKFVVHGEKIRLVGIEVPDIKKAKCEAERIKASDAELRVRAFLDSGPFELVTWPGNDAVVEGHKLRDVTRNGRSLTDVLVSEGLAKRPGSGKAGWCS